MFGEPPLFETDAGPPIVRLPSYGAVIAAPEITIRRIDRKEEGDRATRWEIEEPSHLRAQFYSLNRLVDQFDGLLPSGWSALIIRKRS